MSRHVVYSALGGMLLSLSALGAVDHRPETWFHIIGGNTSKAGLTADLEAIAKAGYGGIQFFHGQVGKQVAWEGVTEQIPCLSPKWDDLVRHAARECKRLNLTFRMQNCPGWSMSGGPWIKPSEAMRKLVYARHDFTAQDANRAITAVAIPKQYADADSDWHDVAYLAFPTPEGDLPAPLKPASEKVEGDVRTFMFKSPVTIRTLELPSPSQLKHVWSYNPDVHVTFEAKRSDGTFFVVCDAEYQQGCWQDQVPYSFACAEATSTQWRLKIASKHAPINVAYVRLWSAARLDNWEGESAHVLRGLMPQRVYAQSVSGFIPKGAIRRVQVGDVVPAGNWTILRVAHVNMKKKNAPAPREATGWECDKLDARGIEANFKAYIGRITQDVLPPGDIKGMIVDSWECERQTWTWQMPTYFKDACGYDVVPFIPALWGWVIENPAATRRFLRDWRQTIGGLITKNYYGHMAKLAHEVGLDVAYETALGDVAVGDILEYWKYCDTPMCEFWQPYNLENGVGHPNFKPVKPCVSAAHIYGKKRVACESYTNCRLTWNENFRILKEQAVRHYARGVTHIVTHTFTHNPQLDLPPPGTSFGTFIGTPFIRKQTWWSFMPSFTKWMAECGEFLERGLADIDVLRYLGDAVDHKPDELEYFPESFKCDYLNADVLFTRLLVQDGRFVLPEGASYARIWIPAGTYLSPKTEKRLAELAHAGGTIIRGSADDAVNGLEVHVVAKDLLWYPRIEKGTNLYFVAAAKKGFQGKASFRTQCGRVEKALDLAPFETRLLAFPSATEETRNGARDGSRKIPLKSFTLSFPPNWGAPASLVLTNLVAWKDLPSVSAEGRAFSGTASYRTTFNYDSPKIGAPSNAQICLHLGDVRDFARVFVNGHEAAALWAAPYACNLTPFLKEGANDIRIDVTSTWYNRLLFDYLQPPEKRKTWTTWNFHDRTPPCFQKNAKLADSGLLGPVTIEESF